MRSKIEKYLLIIITMTPIFIPRLKIEPGTHNLYLNKWVEFNKRKGACSFRFPSWFSHRVGGLPCVRYSLLAFGLNSHRIVLRCNLPL